MSGFDRSRCALRSLRFDAALISAGHQSDAVPSKPFTEGTMRYLVLAALVTLLCACNDDPTPNANPPTQTSANNATSNGDENNSTPTMANNTAVVNNTTPNTTTVANNTTVNNDTPNNEAPNNEAPNVGQGMVRLPPRWVLRDKDGSEVDGVVSPSYTNTSSNLGELDSVGSPCFTVSGLRGMPFVPARSYSLQTGSMDSCTPNATAAYYLDSECQGAPYGVFLTLPTIAKIDNTMLLASGESIAGPVDVYTLSGGQCTRVFEVERAWRYEPLNPDVINHFADGAPYTIAWE